MKKDIYIIKNTCNNKVYIGQAKDSAQRWLSHIYNAKHENKKGIEKQLIHMAMAKYGVDKFHYEILEYQIENYDEREIYWINYYNSMVPNGYNISVGGNSVGFDTNSPIAIFRDEESLMKCISEISSSKKTFTNIARKYNCSVEVIIAINRGERYHRENLIYPLRQTNYKYSVEQIKQIVYSLKYETEYTLKDIAQKYDIDLSQLSNINNGKIYHIYSQKYPIRDKRIQDLPDNTVDKIIDDILNSNMPLCQIAKKYNISRNRISSINSGKSYIREKLKYPLREEKDVRNISGKKYFTVEEIKNIISLLQSDMSLAGIASMFETTKTTIYNINNGKCKRYRLENYKYPIRNIKK